MPDGRIFVSNDHSVAQGWAHTLDDLLRRKTSRISYYDGKQWSYIGRPFAAGNGVLVRQESGKEYLYRSAFFENAVIKYEVIPSGTNQTGMTSATSLQEVARIDVTHGPDNLELDEHGNMLVAVHPSVLRFLMHLVSPQRNSPSHIVQINLANQQVLIGIDWSFLIVPLFASSGGWQRALIWTTVVFVSVLLHELGRVQRHSLLCHDGVVAHVAALLQHGLHLRVARRRGARGRSGCGLGCRHQRQRHAGDQRGARGGARHERQGVPDDRNERSCLSVP
jgi:hypothetical protein